MKNLFFTLLLISLFFSFGFSQQFKVSYSNSVYDKSFTGNVLVLLSKENKEPKNGIAGLSLFPCFSLVVTNVQPGQEIIIDDKSVSYPTILSNIERGEYYVQIVWDRNLGGRSVESSPGNLYSESQKINISKDTKKVFSIVANKMVPELPLFEDTEFIKELKAPSKLLSSFHGKPMTVDAAVILPKEYYAEPNRKFPVLFTVSGFGGDYHRFSGMNKPSTALEEEPIIEVYLDGNCSLGHSVYANSDNNGPWGDALIEDLIPLLEKNYRCNGARLLKGHSSGGWTVLWLQTQYPKVFHGCWSSAPDPVDFRRFQEINLYEDKNMYYDKNNSLLSTGTVAGRFQWITTKSICQLEHVISRGGQMNSFNAVFSKKRNDGMPEEICDSKTGEINATVFANWKKYDIASNLRKDWESLKSDLDGKVRVSVGKQDNFLLHYAVYLLDEQMKDLGSSFQFAYYPGDHFTVFTPDYRKDGDEFLKQKYSDWLNQANNK